MESLVELCRVAASKNRVVGPESIPERGSPVFAERGPGRPPELSFPGPYDALAGKASRNLVVDIHPKYSIILVSSACDAIVDLEGFSDGDYVPLFLLWRAPTRLTSNIRAGRSSAPEVLRRDRGGGGSGAETAPGGPAAEAPAVENRGADRARRMPPPRSRPSKT